MPGRYAPDRLVARKLLITNSIIATIGQFLPAFAALFCVPVILKSLGGAGFAVMNLIWVVLGYFAFFDFGLNRAFIQSVSEFLATNRIAELPSLYRFTRGQVVAFSLKIGPVVLLGEVLYGRFSKGLEHLPVRDLWIISLLVAGMLPLVLMVNFYSGGLIALQEQARLNFLKILFGILFFVAPTLASYFTGSLLLAVASLAASRVIALVFYRRAFWKVGAGLYRGPDHPGFEGKAILSKGLWMFVASVFAPLLTFADRFILGGYAMAEVTKYAIPFDLVSRLGSLQASVIIVLFPAMSALSNSDLGKARKMLVWLSLGSTLAFSMAFIGVLIGGDWFLRLWLGARQAQGMGTLLPVLMLGLIANMVANVLFNNLQATGKESKVAILQGVELLLMTPVWFVLASRFGALGLAWGWSVRVFIDLLALAYLSKAGDREVFRAAACSALIVPLLAGLHLCLGELPFLKIGLSIGLVAGAGMFFWYHFLARSVAEGSGS